MSIIMRTVEDSIAAAKTREVDVSLEPAVARLLDHLAVELAEEYIRLMEAAAADESAPRPSS